MSLLLSLLVALSVLVRGAFVTSVPPELFGDEIDVGYQAYTLFKTGKDLYGQVFPTYLHSLAEWRAPLLMYATVPSVAAFGLTELGVRLPQVLFGSLGVVILFLLTRQLSGSRSLSFWTAFSLALMPWHIIYSRAAFEVVIMLDLVMLATLLFLRQKHFLSLLFLALAMYCYSTAILFVPLWLALLILTRKRLPSPVSIVTFVLILLPLVYHTLAGPARDRFGLLSIFNNTDIVRHINDNRAADADSSSSLWHNKPESFAQILLGNYLRAFSSEFLFIRGDPTHRHSLQVIGQLLPITAPFLAVGLYVLAKNRNYFWLLWLAVAPLPSITTNDGGYHATRLFLMIPPLAAAIGTGLHTVVNYSRRLKPFLTVFLYAFFGLYVSWVAHYYLAHYPKENWLWWHVGFKDALTHLAGIQSDYSRVFINNTYEPSLIRYLFYTSYPPEKFHRNFTLDQPQVDIMPGYDGFTLDGRVFFGTFNSSARPYMPGSVYMISQRDDVGGDWDWRKSPPGDVQVLYTSTNPYDQPVFYLITKK